MIVAWITTHDLGKGEDDWFKVGLTCVSCWCHDTAACMNIKECKLKEVGYPLAKLVVSNIHLTLFHARCLTSPKHRIKFVAIIQQEDLIRLWLVCY